MKDGASDTPASLPQWSIAVGEDEVDSPYDTPAEEVATLASAERYLIGEVLGVGGMGKVYSAYDRKLERHVALKELSRDQVEKAGREVTRKRLLREARLTARIDHPGVVSIFDVGERADGTLFYTMRIVRGQSMATALKAARGDAPAPAAARPAAGPRRSGPERASDTAAPAAARPAAGPRRSGPERASDTAAPAAARPAAGSGRLEGPIRERMLRALLAACDAVGFGHRLGVVHRDLKPGNIMVGEFGETQVVDWGLARDLTETRESDVVGTPAYMSPEQARGEPADARSDVWSLGAILYELVIGRPPHVDDSRSDSPTELVTRAREMTVPKVTGIEPELAAVLSRAIAKDPADRYPDARALAIDLANHLDGRRVLAHDYTSWELVLRLARQWRGPLLAVLVALVAGGAALTFGYLQTEAERERAVQAEADAVVASDRARLAEGESRRALLASQKSLHAMLVARAQSQQAEGARPEAEILAAHALELGESPEARAVLLAEALAPAPEWVEEWEAPPGCGEGLIIPIPRGEGEGLGPVTEPAARATPSILCRTPTELSYWDLGPPRLRWRKSMPSLHLPTMTSDLTLVVSVPGQLVLLDPIDGSDRRWVPEMYAHTGSQSNASEIALSWNHESFVLADRGGARATHRACGGSSPLVPAMRGLGRGVVRWATLCGDGVLAVGTYRDNGVSVSTPHAWPTLESELRVQTDVIGTSALALTPDGESLLVALHDGQVALFVRDGKSLRRRFQTRSTLAPIREVLVSPDGRLGLVRGERSGLALLDLETGFWLSRLPRGDNRAAQFVGARELLTLGRTLRRWRLPEPAPVLFEHAQGVASVATHERGASLAVAVGAGETLHRFQWSPTSPIERFEPLTTAGLTVKSVEFDAAGQEVFSVSATTRGILQTPWRGDPTMAGDDGARRVAYLVDSAPGVGPDAWVVTASYGPAVLAFPLRRGQFEARDLGLPDPRPVAWLTGGEIEHQDLSVAPGHRFAILLAIGAQRVRRLIAHDGVRVDRELVVGPALAAAIERDGESVWTVTHDRLERWDLELERLLVSVPVPEGGLLEVAVSDVGRDLWVAAGDRFGGTRLWAVRGENIELIAYFRDHGERVAALALGDHALVSGSWDRRVRLRALTRETASAEKLERAWGLTLDDVLAR